MAQHRHGLSDEEWALLMPLLPPRETGGRPYGDHRAMLDAMFYRLCTGRDAMARSAVPLRPLAKRVRRWRQWSKSGLRDRVLLHLQGWLEACGAIDWTLMCIDGTNVRAHRAAVGAKDTTACGEPADHALGRSRGGWGTKVHPQTRERMHDAIPKQGQWLKAVVTGFFAYHAVPTNPRALMAFRYHVTDLWRRTLRRRSQKSGLTWPRMERISAAWLPRPRILHPWPEQRFAVKHPRWESSA